MKRREHEAWLDQAACAGSQDDLFFSDETDLQAIAVRICGTCPVTAECWALLQSLTNEQARWGVWAATRPGDRARSRKVRRRVVVHRPG